MTPLAPLLFVGSGLTPRRHFFRDAASKLIRVGGGRDKTRNLFIGAGKPTGLAFTPLKGRISYGQIHLEDDFLRER